VVTHNRGALLEETHYYPFGLTMAGISSKAAGSLQNRYKFNGGNELQNAEFSDGNGLELYDAVNRMYDPQIGRFWQVDELAESHWDMTPYNFASNNP
jgi:RHS repeat-associated protein